MTYEKAIEIIKAIRVLEKDCLIAGLPPSGVLGTSKDVIDACTLAIQALKERHEQEQTFEWCHDCKEYDQEAHCCHRWSKIIGSTIADIKAEMASEIIEQIEKMREKEPYHFLPNLDAYNLFQKIVEDFRDGKGAWAERKKE
jgi:hypothetical protein